MTTAHDKGPLAQTKRELEQALAALATPGAGAVGNLECRLADLQDRFLALPARSLADLEVRLAVVRDLVAGLGPAGYLLHLVDATLADLRAMQQAGTIANPGSAPPSPPK